MAAAVAQRGFAQTEFQQDSVDVSGAGTPFAYTTQARYRNQGLSMIDEIEPFADFEDIDALIAEITLDAYETEEQLWAFNQVLQDDVPLPSEGTVTGVPVTVLDFDYDGNANRGLTARCRRENGTEYRISACDVEFPANTAAHLYLRAYRRWVGLSR